MANINERAIIEAVAANCARLRKGRGFTFDALAKRAGISKAMLVEIEGGRTNPSIATLCRMANALTVGLSELLAYESIGARIVRHARGAGKVFWSTRAGSRAVLVDAVRIRDVGTEIWRWTLAPGEQYEGGAHPAGTREFLHVLRGTLTVRAGNEAMSAGPNEVLNLLADVPHSYLNDRATVCEFEMTVVEAILESTPTRDGVHPSRAA